MPRNRDLSDPSPGASQANLTLPLRHGARVALLAASDLRNKARLKSLALSQARAWVLAVPYKPSLQLKPAEFRQATRYRLGIADHNEEQVGPVCRKCRRTKHPQDAGFVYGDNSTQCHGSDSLHRRHDRLKMVFLRVSPVGRLQPPTQAAPPHPLPPEPSGGCLRSSWRQGSRRRIRCDCRIPAAGTHPDVHSAHPWARRHRRREEQGFAMHQRLRCCGHPLCYAGSGDVWRVVWHGVPPEFPHSGPPSGRYWSTPLFVPERPVPCTFCCHPDCYVHCWSCQHFL
jgi:hypothetical protein